VWRVVLKIMDEVCAFNHIKIDYPTFRKLSPSPL
jgi:hypothetical protein